MNNKVLVKLNVPEIDKTFDIFIPVNEVVWKIKKMLVKCVNDLTGLTLKDGEYLLIRNDNGMIYRNDSELLLVSK